MPNAVYDFEIILGTYEEFLIGYLCSTEDKLVKQSFASHDHTSSLRCLAQSAQYLASGAADDRILIYDLTTRKESNMLVHHESTINCLGFTSECSHLISGGADGVLAITNTETWLLEKKWEKAHKGAAILDIAIHPTGKLALSLGADATLRTWNLVKGRQAYVIHLNNKSKDSKSLEKILWGPDQNHFLLYGGKYTEVWNIEDGGIVNQINYDEKVISCVWLNQEEILVGHENGQITKVNIRDSSKTTIEAHKTRIKSLAKFNDWIVTVSSSGEFKVWSDKLEEILKENTGCRPTCLCIVPTLQVKKEDTSDEEQEIEKRKIRKTGEAKVIITEEFSDEEVVKKPKKKRKNK